jgi:thymidine kinase
LNPDPTHWFLDGQIQLILGPMFSGKSTELIRRLKRYEVAQYKVLIVKYAKVSNS